LIVRETHPYFIVTDGVCWTQAYFTPEASETITKSGPFLVGCLLDISGWSLELAMVDSRTALTSCANLELRLIVNQVTVSDSKVTLAGVYPVNLFRDDESRTYIHFFLYNYQRAKLKEIYPKLSQKVSDFLQVRGEKKSRYAKLESTKDRDYKGYHFLRRTETAAEQPKLPAPGLSKIRQTIENLNHSCGIPSPLMKSIKTDWVLSPVPKVETKKGDLVLNRSIRSQQRIFKSEGKFINLTASASKYSIVTRSAAAATKARCRTARQTAQNSSKKPALRKREVKSAAKSAIAVKEEEKNLNSVIFRS
jgi:hypothetical protein